MALTGLPMTDNSIRFDKDSSFSISALSFKTKPTLRVSGKKVDRLFINERENSLAINLGHLSKSEKLEKNQHQMEFVLKPFSIKDAVTFLKWWVPLSLEQHFQIIIVEIFK